MNSGSARAAVPGAAELPAEVLEGLEGAIDMERAVKRAREARERVQKERKAKKRRPTAGQKGGKTTNAFGGPPKKLGHIEIVKRSDLQRVVPGNRREQDAENPAVSFVERRLHSRGVPRLPAHLMGSGSGREGGVEIQPEGSGKGATKTRAQLKRARFLACLKRPLGARSSGLAFRDDPSSLSAPERAYRAPRR